MVQRRQQRRKRPVYRRATRVVSAQNRTPVRRIVKQPSSLVQVGSKALVGGLGRAAAAGIGSTIGAGLGSFFGPMGTMAGKILGGLGGMAANSVRQWLTGEGDYKVHGNTLMTGGMDPPAIINAHNTGGIIVRHREYIADIVGSTGFVNATYNLNPGVVGTFPWLAQVADAYEEYRWRGMIFEFKTMSSDNILSSATNTALGSVVMATSYNVLNPAFTSKQAMENYEFANSQKPSCSFIHPVECDPKQTPNEKMYVRSGAPPANSDLRLYDLGLFQIATTGMQANGGVIGELWVSYEVEFYKPRFNQINQAGDAGLADHFQTTAFTNALPLNGVVRSAGSTLGCTSSDGKTIIMPSQVALNGTYLCIYQISGSGAAVIAHPTITITGGVLLSAWTANSATFVSNPADGVTSAVLEMSFIFQVQALPSTIVLGTGGTLPTGTKNGDVYIVQIDQGII